MDIIYAAEHASVIHDIVLHFVVNVCLGSCYSPIHIIFERLEAVSVLRFLYSLHNIINLPDLEL